MPSPDPFAGAKTDPLPSPLPEPVTVDDASAEPLEAPSGEVAAPETEAPPEPAEIETEPPSPDIATATATDSGNVNVSVRVDSPGDEAPVVQETPEPDVISPSDAADITPAAAGAEADPPAPGGTEPGTAEAPAQSGPVNTNVSVRVSSPGDNESVTQTNAPPAPTDTPADPESSSPDDIAGTRPEPSGDSDQYQNSDSQYQSENTPQWIWNWTLDICDGIVSTTSSESGTMDSRDWEWNWLWNWSCDAVSALPDAASTADDTTEDRGSGALQPRPANVNVSIRILSPGDDGAVTQTNMTPVRAPSGPDEPTWLWSWTFAWCGATTEITTSAGEGSGLDWIWNWLWIRDCAATEEPVPTPPPAPAPDSGGDTTPPRPALPVPSLPLPSAPADAVPTIPVADTSAPSPSVIPSLAIPAWLTDWVVRTPWTTSLELPTFQTTDAIDFDSSPWDSMSAPWGSVSTAWPTIPSPPSISAIAIDIVMPSGRPAISMPSLPSVIVPTLTGTIQIVIDGASASAEAAPTPAAGPPAPDSPVAALVDRGRGAATESSTSTVAPVTWSKSAASTTRRQEPSARKAHRDSSAPRLPFEFPPLFQAGGSSTSTGGTVPSRMTFGLATVLGVFAFAAPGLGRRIRPARTPSPRSRSHSPLDRPG